MRDTLREKEQSDAPTPAFSLKQEPSVCFSTRDIADDSVVDLWLEEVAKRRAEYSAQGAA